MGHWVLKYWECLLGTEVQEVNCSICLVLEVKDDLNKHTDWWVQGRGAQIIVPTSPSSVAWSRLYRDILQELYLNRLAQKHKDWCYRQEFVWKHKFDPKCYSDPKSSQLLRFTGFPVAKVQKLTYLESVEYSDNFYSPWDEVDLMLNGLTSDMVTHVHEETRLHWC